MDEKYVDPVCGMELTAEEAADCEANDEPNQQSLQMKLVFGAVLSEVVFVVAAHCLSPRT